MNYPISSLNNRTKDYQKETDLDYQLWLSVNLGEIPFSREIGIDPGVINIPKKDDTNGEIFEFSLFASTDRYNSNSYIKRRVYLDDESIRFYDNIDGKNKDSERNGEIHYTRNVDILAEI